MIESSSFLTSTHSSFSPHTFYPYPSCILVPNRYFCIRSIFVLHHVSYSISSFNESMGGDLVLGRVGLAKDPQFVKGHVEKRSFKPTYFRLIPTKCFQYLN